MNKRTKLLITLSSVCALLVLAGAVRNAHPEAVRWMQLLPMAVAALIGARLKVKLPRVAGTLSVNLPFLLLALVEFDPASALAVAAGSSLVQSIRTSTGAWNAPGKVAFSVASTVNALGAALALVHRLHASGAAALALATPVYFVLNVGLVALAIGASERANPLAKAAGIAQWSLPAFVLGGGLATAAYALDPVTGWATVSVMALVALGVYRSFRLYTGAVGTPAPVRAMAARA